MYAELWEVQPYESVLLAYDRDTGPSYILRYNLHLEERKHLA